MSRRMAINELTMKMAVAAAGGTLAEFDAASLVLTEAVENQSSEQKMLEDWSKIVNVWPYVRQIADRAVGSVVEQKMREVTGIPKYSLDPTPIPWSAVSQAWVGRRSIRDAKKAWVSDLIGRSSHNDEAGEGKKDQEVDEVIERIKQDPEIDQHEQRLLGCIVDPRKSGFPMSHKLLTSNVGSLKSTFSQVHLPPHTVDSVRSIVSLPLLYPAAFQHGILKEHGITGCLLFGPPGTGKTLIVRALAKEAECRMLAIAPSDVMDMVNNNKLYFGYSH